MQITKIGHCCLLIKTDTVTVLTDPGVFSSGQNTLSGIHIVLITHEHADHLHVESLKKVLENNPEAMVITNGSVGKILDTLHIPYKIVEGRGAETIHGVTLEAYDAKHEEIYEQVGQVQNTGYFINDTLFYPGDAYIEPFKKVPVLALPVAGPWCKIGDAIRYAIRVSPQKAFPVHDGQLVPERIGGNHQHPKNILGEKGIDFVPLLPGDSITV
jgi:L-ascorbate metabolism protein UlaG (beta-lactamase superfamily)